MKLMILNCYDDEIDVDIGDLEEIEDITIVVLSGDEILKVTKKDGSYIEEDSDRHMRVLDFYDGKYTIYNSLKGINKIEEWGKRNSSNDWIM